MLRSFSPRWFVEGDEGAQRSLCKMDAIPIIEHRNIPGSTTLRGTMLEWQEGVVHVLGGRVLGPHEDNVLMACDGYVTRPWFGVAFGTYANVLVHLPSGTPIVSSKDVSELKELSGDLVRAFDARGRVFGPTREILGGMLKLFQFNQKRRKSAVAIRATCLGDQRFDELVAALEVDLSELLFRPMTQGRDVLWDMTSHRQPVELR